MKILRSEGSSCCRRPILCDLMSISLPPSVLSLPPSVTDGSGASLPAPDPSDKNLSDLEMGGGSSDGELPEAVDLPDADDAGNGFDEAVDLPDDSDDEQLQLASLADDSGVRPQRLRGCSLPVRT